SEHSFGHPTSFKPADAVALKQGALSVTLDTLVQKYALPSPTLLKIDVDGIELKILEGARRVLASTALRTVLVELNLMPGTSGNPVEEYLSQFGFRVTNKVDYSYMFPGMRALNCIFKKT